MPPFEPFKHQLTDPDPQETVEWVEALDAVVEREGPARAQFLLYKVLKRARQLAVGLPPTVQTRYINTVSPEQEPDYPGDLELEHRIRRLIRWNAVVMVLRANARHPGLGGHLATYASSATLYEVGFNHFFRGKDGEQTGDQIFYQGHAAPGMYARAFIEGRLTEAHLDRFRQECSGGGLSSYPHPRLMPEFWEFPTVSMGLGPINAIYQARFNRYLQARGLADTGASRVWAFLGDGECDEPESLGALTLPAREGLDNLTFVINCNLQRLDGPVRGDGKIIQELEAVFRGAGWQVFKVIWGGQWDDLLRNDLDGLLLEKMQETVDGEFQRLSVESGAYIREHFFGPDPRLRRLVEHLSDEDLQKLRRGGHDIKKVYAAFKAATEVRGAPTCILAKTVKGWTLGAGVEGRNAVHSLKKLSLQDLRWFRDTLELPISDDQLEDPPYHHPGADSPELRYLKERRAQLGGSLPKRRVIGAAMPAPASSIFDEFPKGSGKGEVSTTMAFVRLLRSLMKDPHIGRFVVPIIPDEARTFGMESLFREFKIYAATGQKYTPVDAEMLLAYIEAQDGQIIEEGITEAGAMASFTAAGTSYATHRRPMIPFFIFYSMFGFQRVGDSIWAFADARGRGFLMGATAGRSTLQGEGLQHQDGHSLLAASTVPNCHAYDCAFAYEMAVVIEEGCRRMWRENEDVFYYLTLYNENYAMPAMREGARDGILRGLYRFREAPGGRPRLHLLGSGSILREALRAQELLRADYGISADVWSATSYAQLRREALEVEASNRLHPDEAPKVPYVAACLSASAEIADGEPRPAKRQAKARNPQSPSPPVICVSDFISAVPELASRWMPGEVTILGTDGFGRSDTRAALRRHFQIDAESIVVAALSALVRAGQAKDADLRRAIAAREQAPSRAELSTASES